MRVPVSWLRDLVALDTEVTGRQVAERLVAAGLEVETVERFGEGLTGPVVVGEVLAIEELTGFKKPIRYCQVEVGGAEPQAIVCGARNFAVGDRVVVALPGAVLPGGFAIASRKTYGHVSNGMICSAAELGTGEGHDGILVLPADAAVGADAVELLGVRDEVLDIAVTPDRGYALSLRGVARETATAFDLPFRDPAEVPVPTDDGQGHPVRIEDPAGCPRLVARTVTGLDPKAPSPLWLQRRLQLCGVRSISLVVDVTNYVMLELGQPLHAYDATTLRGALTVRRAEPGEKLQTLDGGVRALTAGDLLITDDSGPIGLAGVMGGASTEVTASTETVVLEAAYFDPITIARASRLHKLSSEASRRFERGVDPALAPAAAERAATLLVELGGGSLDQGVTHCGAEPARAALTIAADHPDRVAGTEYGTEAVVRRLEQVGCAVVPAEQGRLSVTPPSWRPDLTDPNDLAEEVIRLQGYDNLPSVLPPSPVGRGYTPAQRLRRRVGQALAYAGHVETPCYPFVGDQAWEALGLAADDPWRRTVRLLNPLSDEEPQLRSTLLPGLLAAARRNVGRGFADLALFELGQVFLDRAAGPAPQPPVDRAPTEAELAALAAALPEQPRRVAAVLVGQREPAGRWGAGRPVSWSDAVEAAHTVARAAGLTLTVRQGQRAPWHPGRCAELVLVTPGGEQLVGFAGELHPRVLTRLQLPPRACAMELDLDALAAADPTLVSAEPVSAFPVAVQDVALVIDESVPAAQVEAALRAGAGELLESIQLFDVYSGEQLPAGKRSVAYALRFRAPDRTLTTEEASAAREAAVAVAAERTGAVLRGA